MNQLQEINQKLDNRDNLTKKEKVEIAEFFKGNRDKEMFIVNMAVLNHDLRLVDFITKLKIDE